MGKIKRRKLSIAIDNPKATQYIDFLKERYDIEEIYSFPELYKDTYKKVDLIVFTGGADLSPSYYGEKTGSKTHVNPKRDSIEFDTAVHYAYTKTPKLGICRGAQLLTVANGGKLIQHVNNHTTSHDISIDTFHVPNLTNEDYESGRINEYENSLTLSITSTHHQMMYPYKLRKNKYELIAWSTYFLSDTYLNGKDEEIDLPSYFLEPEIVYYDAYKSLCIQGHPEFGTCDTRTKQVCLDIINEKLIKEK